MIKKKLKNFDARKVLNVHHFEKLTKIFKEYRNEDGSEGFPLEKFKQVFGEVLDGELNEYELTTLFMKIDANSDGTVVFEEFSSYILASSSQKQEVQGQLEIAIDRSQLNSQVAYIFEMNTSMGVVSLDGQLLLVDPKTFAIINTAYLVKPSKTSWICGVSVVDQKYLVYITDCRTLHILDVLSAKLNQLCLISEIPSSPTSVTVFINDKLFNIYLSTSLGKVWHLQTLLSRFDLKIKETGFLEYSFTQLRDSVFTIKLNYCSPGWIHKIDYLAILKKVVCLEISDKAPFTAMLISTEEDMDNVSLKLNANALMYDFSSLFNLLGIATRDNNIYLYNSFVWKSPTSVLTGHKTTIDVFKIHPNAPFCYSISSDMEFRVWSIYDGQALHIIQYQQTDSITNLKNAALFQDNYFFIGFRDLKVFDTKHSGVSQDRTHNGHCSFKYNSSFKQIVSCGDNVRVFDFESGNEIFHFCDIHEEDIRVFIFDNSERRLVTGSTDGVVKIWNFNNGQLLKTCYLSLKFEIKHLFYIKIESIQYVICIGTSGTLYIFKDDPEVEEIKESDKIVFCNDFKESFAELLENNIYIVCVNEFYTIDLLTKITSSKSIKMDFPITATRLAHFKHLVNIYLCHSDGTIVLCKLDMSVIESTKLNLRKKEYFSIICDCIDTIILGTSTGRIFMLNRDTLVLLKNFLAHQSKITEIESHNDLFITSCALGKVKIWSSTFELIGVFGKHLWDTMDIKTIPIDIYIENVKVSEDLDGWRNLFGNINGGNEILVEYRKNRISKKYWKKWRQFVHKRSLIKAVHIDPSLMNHKIDPIYKVKMVHPHLQKPTDFKRHRYYLHMTPAPLEDISSFLK